MNKLVAALEASKELYGIGYIVGANADVEIKMEGAAKATKILDLIRAALSEHRAAETSDPQLGKRRTIRGYECQRFDGFIWDGDRFLAIYPGYLTRVVVEQAHRIELLEKQLAEHRAEPSADVVEKMAGIIRLHMTEVGVRHKTRYMNAAKAIAAMQGEG